MLFRSVYAKNSKTNEYMPFTGNMSGLLIAEYILSEKKKRKQIPENGALITTIVSSNLAKAIAKEYNLELIETLTGFKYIGEQIRKFEATGSNTYMFGFEESYGCLVGTHCRDKDAITAVMMLSEAAAFYKKQGLTLCDQMENIYKKYGYYKESILTITLKGADGAEKMTELVNSFRDNPLKEIAGYKVESFRDYKKGIIIDNKTNKEFETSLPTSNVLYYELSDDAWCCIRPSGTEPKLKFYMGVKEKSEKEANDKLEKLKRAMERLS